MDTAQESPTPANPSRKAGCLTILAVSAFTLACAAGSALFDKGQETYGDRGLITITVPRHELSTVATYGGCGGLALLVLYGIVSLIRKRILLGILSLVASAVSLVAAFVVAIGFAFSCVPWTTHGSVKGPDGVDYQFLDQSFLQGQTMVIATPTRYGFLSTTYAAKVQNNGDSPRSWAAVVRPTGAIDTYGQLHISPTGTIYGIRSNNKCYLAYDPATGKAAGRGDIEKTSPFALLGPDTVIHQPDADALLAAEKARTEASGPGIPTTESLEEGLKHPNASVREFAQKLLDIRNGK